PYSVSRSPAEARAITSMMVICGGCCTAASVLSRCGILASAVSWSSTETPRQFRQPSETREHPRTGFHVCSVQAMEVLPMLLLRCLNGLWLLARTERVVLVLAVHVGRDVFKRPVAARADPG